MCKNYMYMFVLYNYYYVLLYIFVFAQLPLKQNTCTSNAGRREYKREEIENFKTTEEIIRCIKGFLRKTEKSILHRSTSAESTMIYDSS